MICLIWPGIEINPLKTINKAEELTIRTIIAKELILLTTVWELFENKYLKATINENLKSYFFGCEVSRVESEIGFSGFFRAESIFSM